MPVQHGEAFNISVQMAAECTYGRGRFNSQQRSLFTGRSAPGATRLWVQSHKRLTSMVPLDLLARSNVSVLHHLRFSPCFHEVDLVFFFCNDLKPNTAMF